MENNERETHDFLNVESFSQLPFIRSAPVKEKSIRLFGKEFGGSTTNVATGDSLSRDESPSEENFLKDCENGDSSRKFECHYCFRNFPTSQALGGHQNAHKRERQQAKRAHLQSSAAMVHGGYYAAYHRLPPPPVVSSLSYHNSWNNNTSGFSGYATSNPRFYGPTNHPPINGNPLGLWRIPATPNPGMINRDRPVHHHQSPLFSNNELKHTLSGVGESSISQTRLVLEGKSSKHDQVSLDLHL